MIEFLKMLTATVKQYPDSPAIVDRDGTRTTTYAELYSCALKVNNWLRVHGIGREDVAAIYYPKGLEYIATRIGIIMAGAAWLGLEDIMGKDRIDFAIHDSGCRVVFDMEKWNEAMKLEECHEIADPDPHDLAFLLYTSGSTGNPKGVMQEYGIYDKLTKFCLATFIRYSKPEPYIHAEVTPQSFLTGIIQTIGVLGVRGTLHEVSHEMARDVDALAGYFEKNNLCYGGFSPNLLQIIKNNPRFNFKAAYMGGDSVSYLFSEDYDMITIYAFSEAGAICIFWIDKPYDITPAGYNVSDLDIVLLNENGIPSDEGIICVHVPYFRGYTNEAANFTEINGKKYFRGSDWVKRDENGLYTVLGRMDDMVKITGNRVSLKGLAAAVKRILQLEFCYVNVFIKNGVKLLVAYYKSDKELDTTATNSTLREHMPNFMTIAWFIRIDHIPINANGKVDALAFPKPDLSLRTCPYVKPVNHVQETFCEAIKNVLELEDSVGINDDFFMLGGDSIKAIEVVLHCGIIGLSVQMIYEGRTVRNISALLKQSPVHDTSRDTYAPPPMNVIQLYMMNEIKKHAGIPTLNVPFRINIQPNIDLVKLSHAIRQAIKAHPILSSVVAEKNGQYVFEYRAEFDRDIPVEEMTDEELDSQCRDFVKPFTFDGEPLIRCRIIKTPTHKAVLLDICHVVCDGWSAVRFISDIVTALKGERLERDNTFEILREEAEYRESDLFADDVKYFADICKGENWNTLPKRDHITDENSDAECYEEFHFTRDDVERLSEKYGLGKNGFYIAAAAVAMSAYNDSEDVMFTWTWHGRSDTRKLKAVGLLIKYLPIALHLTDGLTLSSLFENISAQIKDGISHGRVSYCDEEVYGDDLLICLLYQGDIYEHLEDNSVIESLEAVPLNNLTCDNALNVEILDAKKEYGIALDYNGKLYDEGSMKKFSGLFCKACELLLTMNGNATISAVKNLLR